MGQLDVDMNKITPEAQHVEKTWKPAPQGYFVMGRYTSCAWFLLEPDAEALAKYLNYRGGCVYYVEKCK